jgi:hypothetical protein
METIPGKNLLTEREHILNPEEAPGNLRGSSEGRQQYPSRAGTPPQNNFQSRHRIRFTISFIFTGDVRFSSSPADGQIEPSNNRCCQQERS